MSVLDAAIWMLGSLATLYVLLELHTLVQRSRPNPRSKPWAVRMEDGQPLEIWLEEAEEPEDQTCRHCRGTRASRAAGY